MASSGVIPATGSTVTLESNKLTGDTFVFDDNSFRYLVSNTLYTEGDINTLLTTSTLATPVLNPSTGKYSTSFVYDNPDSKQYLYLIWNYTKAYDIDLCYDETDYEVACDDCEPTSYAFNMSLFGSETSNEACSKYVVGEPTYLRTTRYSTGFDLQIGDILYTDPELTTPYTWAVQEYIGFAQPINPSGSWTKWCLVDTDGTVLDINYCL
jgi:hypothetical protein